MHGDICIPKEEYRLRAEKAAEILKEIYVPGKLVNLVAKQ